MGKQKNKKPYKNMKKGKKVKDQTVTTDPVELFAFSNEKGKVLAEFHGHIRDNSDGFYTMHEAVGHCKTLNVGFATLLQHNSLRAWMDFVKLHGLSTSAVIHNIDGVITAVAGEFTIRDSGNVNFKGNPVKLHLIAIGPKLTKDSPLARLMNIKERNDKLVDYGLLNYIAKTRGIVFDEDAIKEYVIEKRRTVPGFNSFGTNDTVEFLKKHNITIAKSERELRSILDKAPRVQRLNIELEDFMKLAHASGAMVIMAHPPTNLCRTPTPEKTIKNFIRLGGAGFELNCNTMDNNWFNIIMNTIQTCTPKYKLIFTASSDCHIISEDIKYGQNVYGKITLESQKEAVDEVVLLEKARRLGKLTHRPYEVSKIEVDNILAKYAQMGKDAEKKYAETLSETSGKSSRISKYKVEEQVSELNPQNFKSFDDYLRACMIEDSYEDTNFEELEAEDLPVADVIKNELSVILDDDVMGD